MHIFFSKILTTILVNDMVIWIQLSLIRVRQNAKCSITDYQRDLKWFNSAILLTILYEISNSKIMILLLAVLWRTFSWCKWLPFISIFFLLFVSHSFWIVSLDAKNLLQSTLQFFSSGHSRYVISRNYSSSNLLNSLSIL